MDGLEQRRAAALNSCRVQLSKVASGGDGCLVASHFEQLVADADFMAAILRLFDDDEAGLTVDAWLRHLNSNLE